MGTCKKCEIFCEWRKMVLSCGTTKLFHGIFCIYFRTTTPLKPFYSMISPRKEQHEAKMIFSSMGIFIFDERRFVVNYAVPRNTSCHESA
jgi:hypothetical protein